MDISQLDLRDFRQARQARKERDRPFVIAHRGASSSAPENTMAAFNLAVKQGAHFIESDLWFTLDKEIVLHHDRTLDRTMGRPEAVGMLSQGALLQCSALETYTGGEGSTYLPLLEELLEVACAEKLGLLLEMKDPLFSQPGYGEILLQKLGEYDLLNSCFLISFSQVSLATMQDLDPHLPMGLVSMGWGLPRGPWSLYGPLYLNLVVNPLYPFLAHRKGSLVAPLDPRPHLRIDLYKKIGVDAILADDVEQIVELLNG